MVYSQDQTIGNPGLQLTHLGLFRRMRSNQADISSLLDAVESAQRLFRSNSDVYWQQCEHVAGILRLMLVPGRDLLDITTRLPDEPGLQRAPLVSALHVVISTIEDLAPLIVHYPFANKDSSHPTIAQRWDIQRKFDQLIDGCYDILRQATRLLDRAYFPAAL